MPLSLRHWVPLPSQEAVEEEWTLDRVDPPEHNWPPLHQSLIPAEIVGQLVAVGKGTEIHDMNFLTNRLHVICSVEATNEVVVKSKLFHLC